MLGKQRSLSFFLVDSQFYNGKIENIETSKLTKNLKVLQSNFNNTINLNDRRKEDSNEPKRNKNDHKIKKKYKRQP